MPRYVMKETATGLVRKFITTPPDIEYPAEFVDNDATLIEFDWAEGQADSSRFYMPADELVERPQAEIAVAVSDVQAEAERRIIARYPLGKQNTIILRGGGERDDMQAFIDAIIAASHRIEAMKPIPPDFAADHHWN